DGVDVAGYHGDVVSGLDLVGVQGDGADVAVRADLVGQPGGDGSGTGAHVQAPPPGADAQAGQDVDGVLVEDLAQHTPLQGRVVANIAGKGVPRRHVRAGGCVYCGHCCAPWGWSPPMTARVWMTTLERPRPSVRTWRRYHGWVGVWSALNRQSPRGLGIAPSPAMAALIDSGVGSGPAAAMAISSTWAASQPSMFGSAAVCPYSA